MFTIYTIYFGIFQIKCTLKQRKCECIEQTSRTDIKMSANPTRKQSHTSVSKSDKIMCRVETCQDLVVIQNYGRHLERYHPGEDHKDRRPYGKEKFSFNKPKVVRKDIEVGVNTDGKEDLNLNICPNNVLEGQQVTLTLLLLYTYFTLTLLLLYSYFTLAFINTPAST